MLIESWVSGTGENFNDCATIETPCLNIGGDSGALAKTAVGGTIYVLPGTYSSAVIDKAVQIVAVNGRFSFRNFNANVGGVLAPIIVNAPFDQVVRIRGLVIPRADNTASAVAFLSGQALHLEDCALVGSTGNFGLSFLPIVSSKLIMSNCVLSENHGGGILIKPSGSGSARVTLDHVRISNNQLGVRAETSGSGVVYVTMRDSFLSGNVGSGLVAENTGGSGPKVVIVRTESVNNSIGLRSAGTGTILRVGHSTITRNGTGLSAAGGGQLISQGGNIVAENSSNGSFTSTLPLQ